MPAKDFFGIRDAVKRLSSPPGLSDAHQEGFTWAVPGDRWEATTKLTAEDYNLLIGNLRRLLIESGLDLNALDPQSPRLLSDAVAARVMAVIETLQGRGIVLLGSVAGTADALTAALPASVTTGLRPGMVLLLPVVSSNTGAVTLSVGSDAFRAVQNSAGEVLAAGALLAGTRYLLHFDGSVFRILNLTGDERSAIRRMDRPQRPRVEKWLVTSDWQPTEGDATQIAYLRKVMANIAAVHPDIDYAYIGGDFVDNGNLLAVPPARYSFPEIYADMRLYLPMIPRDRWMIHPGNHDRFGGGLGTFRDAWTNNPWRDWVGPEFFATRKGNTLRIYMGDMAGSIGGEILDYVVEWFGKLLARHQDCNVFVHIHQPVVGAHPSGMTENSSAVQFNGATRLKPLFAAYADRIAAVFYGHVGSGLDTGATVTMIDGIRHINTSLAVPSLAAGAWVRAGVYSTVEFVTGVQSLTLKRWLVPQAGAAPGAATYAGAAYDVVIPLKYTIDVGGAGFTMDSRYAVDPMLVVTRNERVHYDSLASYRGTVAPFTDTTEVVWADSLILGDDASGDALAGQGMGQRVYLPAKVNENDTDGYGVTGQGGYSWAGGWAIRRLNGTEDDYASYYEITVRNTKAGGDNREIGLQVHPTSSGTPGLWAPNNISSGAQALQNHGVSAAIFGAQLRSVGSVLVSRNSWVGSWQRTAGAGVVHYFYNDTTLSGSISVNGAATTYGTTSDYRAKEHVEPLGPEPAGDLSDLPDALQRLMRTRPVSFDFIGQAASFKQRGFIAHELQAQFPGAVLGTKDATYPIGLAASPDGYWVDDVRREDCPEDWTWQQTGTRPELQQVDLAKLVPDLVAAVQTLTGMVLGLQNQIGQSGQN